MKPHKHTDLTKFAGHSVFLLLPFFEKVFIINELLLVMRILSKIEQLLIGLWLGAALFFAFGVAPSAFSVLPETYLAGNVVSRTLTIINFSGLVIGGVLLLLSFISRGEAKMVWAWIQRVLLFIVALACGAGQAIIGLYMTYLRSLSDQPISNLPADNPLKMQFDAWHQYSVWILMAAMVAALLAFFVMSRSYPGNVSKKKDDPLDFDLPDELKI